MSAPSFVVGWSSSTADPDLVVDLSQPEPSSGLGSASPLFDHSDIARSTQRDVLVGPAPARLHDADPIPLLGGAQRGDAAAEAGIDITRSQS